jgi:hypothetical protein
MTFKDKQTCNMAYIPAMFAFAKDHPEWTIKLIACGKEEIET